jgi:hypothetical protein
LNNFCIITPTRGDRHKLLDFNISRIDGLPSIIVDYSPKANEIDIVPRVQEGIKIAKELGFEFVFIMEDDDHYPTNYFDAFDYNNFDFVGYEDTYYYNIKNRTYQKFDHAGRSSLFCTGFRISTLDQFNWPNNDYKFLDIRLWEYAQRTSDKIQLLKNNPALGIKGHGIGRYAGKGHELRMKETDADLSFLRSRVDYSAWEFYLKLIKEI